MWLTHNIQNLKEAKYLVSRSSYKEERDIDGPTSSFKLAGHSQKETHLSEWRQSSVVMVMASFSE